MQRWPATLTWQTGHTLPLEEWMVKTCRACSTSDGVNVELLVSMKCSLFRGSIEVFL